MAGIQRIILIVSVIATTLANETKPPQTTVTRTELRVSRSFDPNNAQLLNVLTKSGDVATLIVKKRDGIPAGKTLEKSQDPRKSNKDLSEGRSQTTNKTTTPRPSTTKLLPVKAEPNDLFREWAPIQTLVLEPNFFEMSESREHNDQLRASVRTTRPQNVYITSETFNRVPKPVNIRSDDIYVKDPRKKSRAIEQKMKIDYDGIPIVEGVRVPDDPIDQFQTWRNARVINGELFPYEADYKPPRAVPIAEFLGEKGLGPFTKDDNFGKDANGYELIGTRSNHVHEQAFGPFTKADNSRIANSKLIDYIKEINAQETKRDYFERHSRNERFGPRYQPQYQPENQPQYQQQVYNHPQHVQNQPQSFFQPQIQRRMLQDPGNTNYPDSKYYSTKLNPVNVVQGVRTPILQYAHPELGIQPVKVTDESETRQASSLVTLTNEYLPEPAPLVQAGQRTSGQLVEGTSGVQRIPGAYYRKDHLNYPYDKPYTIKPYQSQPMWYTITETIKDNLHTGLRKVNELTQPVFEPLHEATQRLSYNLGLTNTPPMQNKVGVVDGGTSIFLPAMGLVAGGAALGLSAAAMGKLLDFNLMRSGKGLEFEGAGSDRLKMEHKRALEAIRGDGVFVVVEETVPQGNQRQRRSVDRDVDDKYVIQEVLDHLPKEMNGIAQNSKYWRDTSCAKRVFCEEMMRKDIDTVDEMDKSVQQFLERSHQLVIENVSRHLEEALSAVRTNQCAKFECALLHQ